MRKIVVLCLWVALIATLEAKEKKEPVVMTVAGKDVTLSEFIYMAKKDNSVNFKNKKAVAEYVELFKNFKLKVADAEALEIHNLPAFLKELEKYTLQLQASFLSDKTGQDSAMLVIHNREKIRPVLKQIFFRYPEAVLSRRQIFTKDTLELFLQANAAYTRIKNGESFEEVGQSFADQPDRYYFAIDYAYPFKFARDVEEFVYNMKPGDISRPVRSMLGFYLFKMEQIIPNPGKISVAHLITAFPSNNPSEEEIDATRKRSEEVYQKALQGDDFSQLILTFSDDSTSAKKDRIFEFGLGEILEPIEKAGFALENIGDISKPFQTVYGFHILKLMERKPVAPFEEVQGELFDVMISNDRIFDLYKSFEERMKVRHGYVFYPEAYRELELLADENFPIDSVFVYQGLEMEKILLKVGDDDFNQSLFVEYMYYKNLTRHIYTLDFMYDVFRFFVREILTEVEKRTLERDYPEYKLQLKEYYDGILLYDLSNKRVWSRAEEDQPRLETEWIKELNEKYPVKINWKVIRKIKKV